MRNLKKFLALVMAMVMTFSLMLTVNAANPVKTFDDADQITPAFAEAADVLVGMKVFQGDERGFAPAAPITRAEVATLIYRLATGDTGKDKVDLYTTTHPFVDVKADDWFAGYVGYCWNAGYIKGTTATTFNPYANVTGYEVLAMVLRAMGYDANNEFTGGQWIVNVSATAQQRGLLADVKSTHYANTLHLASRRDVVASILFQAAQKTRVKYTPAFGYQTGDHTTGSFTDLYTDYTPLGVLNFGLTSKTGIVVGNQATGEDYTKVSYAVANTWKDGAITNIEVGGGDYSYEANAIDAAKTSEGSITLTYSVNTGLDLFGHKVTMWYDSRSTKADAVYNGVINVDSQFATVYAYMDRATLVKTVFANKGPSDGLFTAKKATTAGATSVYTAAKDAGFHKDSNPQWGSDRFSQMGELASWTSNGDGATAVQSNVGMYRIISNNDDKKADVVISLNQEVAQINQRNTTAKDNEYIFLDSGNSSFGSQLSTGTAGKIFDDQLSPASVKTLGTLVTVHQIVGTNSSAKVHGAAAASRAWNAGAAVTTPTASVCWYQTDKLEPSFTGTIATYKQGSALTGNWLTRGTGDSIVTEVTLTDGTSYKLSGITGSKLDYGFDTTDSHLINGVTPLTTANTYGGVTYSFYEDEVGRIIGVSIPNEYEFLYTTFADYEIGALGTGTIGYYAYGVNWNGEIVKANNQVKKITIPVDNATPTTFTEAMTVKGIFPSTGLTLAQGYNFLPVTMKDQGSLASTIGNQIKEGGNTRFMMDGNGNLSWYSEGAPASKYGNRFTSWYNSTAADYKWTITAQDAKNGFVRVYNDKDQDANTAAASGDNWDYLLTDTTKFIVVTGSGTADLSVKIYTGLTDLLQGGTSAEIASGFDSVSSFSQKTDNVYFLTVADQFGNTDVTKNRTITTVIMSDKNLTQYNAQSMYFAAPGAAKTNVKLADATSSKYTAIDQYKLYNNGVASYYWVEHDGTDPEATGTADKGDFYRLTPVDTVNGQTIYKATKATSTVDSGGGSTFDIRENNAVDVKYDYIVVNNLSTAEIKGTNGQVFKVDGAIVAEAYGENVKGGTGTKQATFVEPNTIDSVEKLHHAVSMGKDGTSGDLYYVYVAIVNDGVNVSCIYVTDVNTLTH